MKNIIVLLSLLCFTACSESEVYYTTHYSIEKLNAVVQVAENEANPEESVQLAEEISKDVLQMAPIKAGGSYVLDYTLYNGGPLTVTPYEGATAMVGTFTKEPAAKQITFNYADTTYTALLNFYTPKEEGAQPLTRLDINLTEHYQEKYSEEAVIKVIREEYSTTPYR